MEEPVPFEFCYASYLVRIWCTDESGSPLGVNDWQGEVEHIQSGRRTGFASVEEMTGLLLREGRSSNMSPPATTEGQERGSDL